jgi:tRNA (cytidine56-2'-O)-methyltransferase
MENSNIKKLNGKEPKLVVLRWGHRPQRDARLTTHVALTARALCTSGFILSDIEDKNIQETVRKVTGQWGGDFFFRMGTSWRSEVRQWRESGGIVVHLTVYGENIQSSDVLSRIKAENKNIMVLVGSQKVPPPFYSSEVSDFNVAVGNQPHSECSALAIFLDRFFEGKELAVVPDKAKIEVVPQKRGKKMKSATDCC